MNDSTGKGILEQIREAEYEKIGGEINLKNAIKEAVDKHNKHMKEMQRESEKEIKKKEQNQQFMQRLQAKKRLKKITKRMK